jgi:hypothetical protein
MAFIVASLPATNQLSKAAYCDVVKLQGTWPSRGRQPTPARLSGPAMRQVGTTAMVEQCPKLIPSARFSPRIVIRVRPAMNHDAGMNLSARSLAVRGLNLWSYSVTIPWWSPSESVLKSKFQDPDLKFLCDNLFILLWQSCWSIIQLWSCYSNHTQILTGLFSKELPKFIPSHCQKKFRLWVDWQPVFRSIYLQILYDTKV